MENNEKAVTQTETVETENKTEATVTEPVKKTEEVKTFTQDQVNAMLAKEKKKMPSKEDLKAFNEWKESQKSEEQKQTERAQEFAKLKTEKEQLEQLTKIYDAGVTGKDNVEFIQFKVSKMEGDFDENLKAYLDEHPNYLQKEVEEESSKATGDSVKRISKDSEKDGVTAILKQKHPEINF